MKPTSLLALLVIMLCCTFSPAQAGSANESTAQRAARAWLSLIDAGRYADSWQDASTYFTGAVSRQKWEADLNGVRKPLGKLVSRKVAKTKEATTLPGAPDGRYVVMVFTSSFEHKKTATETVTFMLDQDGAWRAAGYFIK